VVTGFAVAHLHHASFYAIKTTSFRRTSFSRALARGFYAAGSLPEIWIFCLWLSYRRECFVMSQELLLSDDMTQKVKEVLHSQHAIMGIFGNVFERLGGEQFLYEWAEDNPTKFITLMTKMVPTLQPSSGLQGDVRITVHPALGASPLDA